MVDLLKGMVLPGTKNIYTGPPTHIEESDIELYGEPTWPAIEKFTGAGVGLVGITEDPSTGKELAEWSQGTQVPPPAYSNFPMTLEAPGGMTVDGQSTFVGEGIIPDILSSVGAALGSFLAGPVGGVIGTGAGYIGGEIMEGKMSNGAGTYLQEGVKFLDGVPLVGLGVPEPPTYMVKREWRNGMETHIFYQLYDGRILVLDRRTNSYVKVYRPPKHIVLSKNPRLATLLKAAKRVDNLLLKTEKRINKFKRRTRR